jgi:two-component system chemotaxis response regulator CheB
MLRVLIADDSQVIQRTLKTLIDGVRGIEVVGVASDGDEAVRLCRELRPDLVTMDVYMPGTDGLEATRQIMDSCPTRIVIVSAMVGSRNAEMTFEAMRAGAIEVIEKPRGSLTGNYTAVRESLIRVLTQAGEARPEGQLSWLPPSTVPSIPPPPLPKPETDQPPRRRERIPRDFLPRGIFIGGSTGAPAVIAEVLRRLPADYPLPIVVAQHIARGFVQGLASWLDATVPLTVKLAEQGDELIPGLVLVGPDDRHIELDSTGLLRLRPATDEREHTPSIDRLFGSVAQHLGPYAVGVVLSGMGSDGAAGLRKIYDAGGVTLVQNEESSVVYGMPKMAIGAGAATREISPEQLVQLFDLFASRARKSR